MYKPDKYTVLDLETSIRAPQPHFGAAPMWPSNRTIMLGFKNTNDDETTIVGEGQEAPFIRAISKQRRLLVGHNLPFDLLYLMRKGLHLSNHRLWDTQKFYYIERGKSGGSTSLENVAKHYGIPFKKDIEIKERFKVGIGADKIDADLLREYLVSDVEVTEQIFLAQVKLCTEMYFTRYVRAMMDSLGPTTQMNFYGIAFDARSAKVEMATKEAQLSVATAEFVEKWTRDYPAAFRTGGATEFNPASSVQIGRRLWGSASAGPLRETVTETLDETYKSGAKKGQRKTKKVTKEHHVKGLVSPDTAELFEKSKWQTDGSAQTIKRLKKHDAGKGSADFVADLEHLRHLSKEIGTYYKPYISYSIGDTTSDEPSVLYPNFNHCVTATGRLSSSKPNFQNINGKNTA